MAAIIGSNYFCCLSLTCKQWQGILLVLSEEVSSISGNGYVPKASAPIAERFLLMNGSERPAGVGVRHFWLRLWSGSSRHLRLQLQRGSVMQLQLRLWSGVDSRGISVSNCPDENSSLEVRAMELLLLSPYDSAAKQY